MVDVEFVNVYPYQHELIVEVAVREASELTVHSIQFDYCGEGQVEPRTDVGDQFRDVVEAQLAEAGYATV